MTSFGNGTAANERLFDHFAGDQLNGFALHLDRLKIYACDVTSWVIDAIDEAGRDWIGAAGKYDWDCGFGPCPRFGRYPEKKRTSCRHRLSVAIEPSVWTGRVLQASGGSRSVVC